MLLKNDFQALLENGGTLVLDGALATELEARGHNLNHPLWSAKTLQDSGESIRQVHLDYYLAGADVAITASYQATPQGLREHFGMPERESADLIKKSVELAQRARDEAYLRNVATGRKLLVAGSVGPYGAYLANGAEYTGDYRIGLKELKDFHRPRIQALVDADADVLALETIPNVVEIEALLALLAEEFPDILAWLSCTLKSPDLLSDGTSWETVLNVVKKSRQVIAFGINCVPLSQANDALRSIRLHCTLPLVCYPNSGEIWDATTKSWNGAPSGESLSSIDQNTAKAGFDGVAADVGNWIEIGAKLVGGCCRTGPAYIQAISTSLQR